MDYTEPAETAEETMPMGPELPEEDGMPAQDAAAALGITEAPSAKTQLLLDQHPEIWPDYQETVMEKMIMTGPYPPEKEDVAHTTYPFLTLYEKTKILGLRASQLAQGARPFIDVPDYLTTEYEIAVAELKAKRLPFIIKRPLPNGEFEYWRLTDLMII